MPDAREFLKAIGVERHQAEVEALKWPNTSAVEREVIKLREELDDLKERLRTATNV